MKIDKKKSMHISVSYQGTMPVQEGHLGACGDDYMRLALYIDGYADSLAYAVVNFPMIEGRKVLFIHEIFLYQKGKTECEILLETIMGIAVAKGYDCIYANKGKMPECFLKKNGFGETDGNLMKKEVE